MSRTGACLVSSAGARSPDGSVNGAPQTPAADVLRSTTLFAGLDDDALRGLAAACVRRVYGRGQYLWYQGDEGDRLVIVVSGLMKVVLSSAQGEEVVLRTLGPHATAGELAILDGAPRSAAVVAVEPTAVLMLGRATVLDLMTRHRSSSTPCCAPSAHWSAISARRPAT